LRVLVLHNRYQIPGGEDSVFAQETAMLRAAGVTVETLETSNDHIEGFSQTIKAALLVPYSIPSRNLVAERIRAFRPDVMHAHNLFPTLTPSVYDACRQAGVPVIQTLHNYRLMCANAQLFRDGKVCTECLGKAFPIPAIRHSCYRGNRSGSIAVASMIGLHRMRHTWTRKVTRFIALTEFARSLFSREMGIPMEQLALKPNAAADPGVGDGAGGYALFVGRLSPEKGIEILLQAAAQAGGLGMPLKIAGSGSLQAQVEAAHARGNLEYVGHRDAAGVRELMKQARVLLIPSLWYEGLPMAVPEAFGAGLPIITSRIGALETLIEDRFNGLLIEPGNRAALAQAVRAVSKDSQLEQSMRSNARKTYEDRYHPEANLRRLLEIYEEAIEVERDRKKQD
jgi:glycosyltransferase involved in cell wall biosynthesis